ncbi:hypothetical protein [Paracoccus versutus]
MNMIYTEAYRTAFDAYLRKGIPIRLTLKQTGAGRAIRLALPER